MKILITGLLIIFPNIVFAQAVVLNIKDKLKNEQQIIDDDKSHIQQYNDAIANLQSDIDIRKANIKSIVNDSTATAIIDQIPEAVDLKKDK